MFVVLEGVIDLFRTSIDNLFALDANMAHIATGSFLNLNKQRFHV